MEKTSFLQEPPVITGISMLVGIILLGIDSIAAVSNIINDSNILGRIGSTLVILSRITFLFIIVKAVYSDRRLLSIPMALNMISVSAFIIEYFYNGMWLNFLSYRGVFLTTLWLIICVIPTLAVLMLPPRKNFRAVILLCTFPVFLFFLLMMVDGVMFLWDFGFGKLDAILKLVENVGLIGSVYACYLFIVCAVPPKPNVVNLPAGK